MAKNLLIYYDIFPFYVIFSRAIVRLKLIEAARKLRTFHPFSLTLVERCKYCNTNKTSRHFTVGLAFIFLIGKSAFFNFFLEIEQINAIFAPAIMPILGLHV